MYKKIVEGQRSKWSLIHPLHNGQSDNESPETRHFFFCSSVGSIIYADLTEEEGGKKFYKKKKNITRRSRIFCVCVCNHSCVQTSVASAPKLTAGESCAHAAASNVHMIAFWVLLLLVWVWSFSSFFLLMLPVRGFLFYLFLFQRSFAAGACRYLPHQKGEKTEQEPKAVRERWAWWMDRPYIRTSIHCIHVELWIHPTCLASFVLFF